MEQIKKIELNELVDLINKNSDTPMLTPKQVLANKFGDEEENQSDIKLLYDFRIRKIVTTFTGIKNSEHYAIQVKRKKEQDWVSMAWSDDEDGALSHINMTLSEKYPSWIEKAVFGQRELGCKEFKYID